MRDSFERYRRSLDGARRVLFERFRFVDAAYKVVGVGSVGTRCLVGLFAGTDGSPFVLQMKEAAGVGVRAVRRQEPVFR